MIITITVNPSTDRLYAINKFKRGKLNRVNNGKKMVGGKGINAARVASILGALTYASGFLGGENGKFILSSTKQDKFIPDFIHINGETRNCYTIIEKDGHKTEINEAGAPINSKDVYLLASRLHALMNTTDVSSISINGSLATGMPSNSYVKLIRLIRKIDPTINVILDASGAALKNVVNSGEFPDFIKPNEHELADMLNIPVTTDAKTLMQSIVESNLVDIKNIFVSLGANGGLVKHNSTFYTVEIPKISAINTEGSGDATVGGMLSALDEEASFEEIMRSAMAAGTANAMESRTGYISLNNFFNIKNKIKINEMSEKVELS